jgi:hypothetical protein
MSITVENGGSVRIPDRYLSTGKNLVVYDVQAGNDDEETVVSVKVFPVKEKAKPKNYAPTAAEEAYGIVKLLTDEAKEAAGVAEQHSIEAGEYAASAADKAKEAADEAAEATNQAGMAERYAENAEAAAAKLEPLIVTTNGGSYSASSNAEDIWNAVAAGRDVILEIRGYDGPEDCSAPILSATEEQSIFAVIDAGNLLLFAIDRDRKITRTYYPLSRYAILDDRGDRQLSLGKLRLESQGGVVYLMASQDGTDANESQRPMLGFEEATIVSCVAPGRLPNEAVNKAQLDEKAELDDSLTGSGKTWSAQKILAMIAQGGTGDIDMGDGRAVRCGRVSAPEFCVTDSIAEGFYVTSELVGGDYHKPIAAFYGTHGDQPVVLRYIAPGTNALDAVNKDQLDAVEATANSKAKIDNTAVGADAWSSQNTVDKLCPKVNENSPCVQMQPVGGSRVKVSAKKDSEYPYIKLYCTGKNLLNPKAPSAFTEGYVNRNNGNLIATNTSIASAYIPVSHLVGQTLAIAGAYVGGNNPGFAFYDSAKTFMGTQYSGNTATALVPKGAAYFRFTIKYDNIRVDGVVDYSRIQLEIGNAVTEVEAYREIPIDPATGDIELDRVFLDGVNTFYAYAGSEEEQTNGRITFVPTKAVDIHVEGYNHPEYEIEKQRKEIEQLISRVSALEKAAVNNT